MEDLELVTEMLGGRRTLGLRRLEPLKLVDQLRLGLPSIVVVELAQALDMTGAELLEALRIPRRTLSRRKGQARLDRGESEAVVRVARTFARAQEVLGDPAAAHRWMRKPNRALGGQVPMSLLDTSPGAELVLEVLERLEQGAFS